MSSSKALSSARLEIHLLGRFAVYVDGKLLDDTAIKGRKARSLLKLITHKRHHQMVRDHAIDILWPDLRAKAAASQLYKALHHIRKALVHHTDDAENWITITDDLIRIVPPGGVVTDVQQFEEIARKGLRDENISALETAVSIYTGDFLPMDRYVNWVTLPREHYRQLYLDILTKLARQYEQRNDLSEAAEMLRLALEKEPTLETAHRGLMRIFAQQGQMTRAFHQYDRCREVLSEELGMSPSTETKDTLNDIREGQLSKNGESSPLRTTAPSPLAPIIGRTEACHTIDRLLRRLADGNGGSLLISGQVGIGKTRLIRELTLRSRQHDLSFFLGQTGEGMGTVTYGPFIELFEDILHKHPELQAILPTELVELIPGISGEGSPVPHADKLAAKGYLFAQVHRFFSTLAETGPLVIILEDLHAADQGSRGLFSYLIRHSKELPILFAGTARKELAETDFDLSALRNTATEMIELAPLTFGEHLNLLHLHAETTDITPDIARRIFDLSEGTPLFALELLEHYNEQEQSEGGENRSNAVETFSSSFRQKIPATLLSMVGQKVEKLSRAAHYLLYISAVIGRRVSYGLLESVWQDSPYAGEEPFFDALEEVIRIRLLEERGLDYTFHHALVREAIYASISEARRQKLHKRVAEQLIRISDDAGDKSVEQIAHHFLRAGEPLKSAHYLLRAGKRATETYAHEDALQRYREACEMLEGVESKQAQSLRCKAFDQIGDVHRVCGQLEKSYEAYEKAIELAEEIPLNNTDLVELHRKMAVSAILRTEIDRSEQYLAKAFKLVQDDPQTQARLYITKALHLWHLNRLEEAYEVAQKALKMAENADAMVEASQACEILAMTCLPLGRWEEGLEYEMQRQIYGWSPEIVVATDAHLCLWEYHVSGDQPLKQARSFLEQVTEQAAEFGNMRCIAVCHYALGTMHLWRGQRHRAVDELSSSLELHEQVGSPAGMAYSLARKSVLHTLMGAADLGWQAVQDGLAHAKQAAVRDHCLQRLYGVGIWNRLEAEEMVEAQHLVDQSEQLLNQTRACGACALELYPWLAYFYLQTNNFDRARECSEAVSKIATQTGNPIGKAIAAMIESSLCVTDQDEQKARKCSQKSFKILKDAVSGTSHSPVAHYLECMVEQQRELREVI